MAWIYAADIYCDSCGKAIREQITAEGKAPESPDDERSYDSDEFPKYADDDEETDGPQHCACNEECLEAEELPSGRKIGALIGTNLTTYGVEYLKEMMRERPTEVTEFWRDRFSDYDLD